MILTIGHSTHTADRFLELLQAHRVRQLADIRTFAKSRRHPHFAGDALEAFLSDHGVTYRHFPDLGGLRKPRLDSVNTAWRHPSFRGYADHMQTPAFKASLDALLLFADCAATVLMCAEAVWWQCHRRLLSDALLVVGVPVRHILSLAEPKPHELSEFARVEGHEVSYPGLL